MANFALTTYETGVKQSVKEVIAALKTQLEGVDDSKTIRDLGIVKAGTGGFVGYAIYDT